MAIIKTVICLIFIMLITVCYKDPTQPDSSDQNDNLTIVPVDTVMVYIPAGEFLMGNNYGYPDEKPEHIVYLDSYWIDKYEVTNWQYAAFLNENYRAGKITTDSNRVTKGTQTLYYLDHVGSQITFKDSIFIVNSGKENHPVTEVSWIGADEYAKYYGKRLPTEAEWEKAARSTDSRIYPWGDTSPTDSLCNYKNHVSTLTAVGTYSPQGDSPYGCCDMAGNAAEWCADWYVDEYYLFSPRENPPGPPMHQHQFKVKRGGSYIDISHDIRCSARDHDHFDSQFNIGFRCVR